MTGFVPRKTTRTLLKSDCVTFHANTNNHYLKKTVKLCKRLVQAFFHFQQFVDTLVIH